MTNQEVLRDWLEKSESKLIDAYDVLGLRASGRFAQSLESFVFDLPDGNLRGRIEGVDYTQFMVNGRGRNRKQSPEQLAAWVGWAGSTFLKQWVRDKGLNISPYAVAWKIAKEGIKVPNRYNKGTLLSMVFTSQWYAELSRNVASATIETKLLNRPK
jgi:hypothetical protein